MLVTVKEAIDRLKNGSLVALPTETVYGLAASILDEKAIAKIFTIKGRPRDNPLIVHISHLSQLEPFIKEFPPKFEELADRFWPGALSLVLPAQGFSQAVTAGLPTVCVRMPAHLKTVEVIETVGPIVMPSANLSGKPSATTQEHVENDFGDAFPVVDGGSCEKGLESTILGSIDGRWVLLRLGSISAQEIASILGYTPKSSERLISPGQKHRHYSPEAQLTNESNCDVVIGFSDREYGKKRVFVLGHSNDPVEVSHRLYAVLRQLDEEGVLDAYVDMNFPRSGLWQTIRERLERAMNKK